MFKIQIKLGKPGRAQGVYRITARGAILAVLRWGTQSAPLETWSPFAYVPIDPAGNGSFVFTGNRGIPPEAASVHARCYLADFSRFEDIAVPIPAQYQADRAQQANACTFSVLTDLHLTAKPWKIKRALQAAQSDRIFLLGDSTNDGTPDQFSQLYACVQAVIPGASVFPVIGNHDIPGASDNCRNTACERYGAFQERMLRSAEQNGFAVTRVPGSLAYTVPMGALDIIGLQCVTAGRRFSFADGNQLDWLEEHLSRTEADWHIILCHAPLLHHHPNRHTGMPYLDQDRRLQDILERRGGVIFLSGHTHVSPNILPGNAEYDAQHQNVYLNCGSVVPTDISGEHGIMAPDWKDGCITELCVSRDAIEISMRSVDTGIRFSRGYYRFYREPRRTASL